MPLTFVRTKLGFLIVALVALAVIAAACSSSDDGDARGQADPADETQEAAAEQSQSQVEGEPLEAEEREQAQAQAEVQGQGIDASQQSEADDEESGAPGSDEQAVEQVEEQAEAQAQDQAEEQAEAEEEASEAVAAAASVQLGDLSAVQDLRFEGVVSLDLTASAAGDDADLLGALSEVTLDGGFVAPGDFELTVRLGEDAAFPPIGIISLGDTLYTNLGFGWQAQEGGAGGLLDLFGGLIDPSALGVDPDALDAEALDDIGGLGGLGGLLPEDLSLEDWDEGGSEDLAFGPAMRYTIETASLAELLERLLGDSTALEDAPLGLSALEGLEGSADGAVITIWIDEATSTLAAMSLVIENLAIEDFDGEGNALAIGLVEVRIEVNPEFGLPVELVVNVEDLAIEGPDGGTGDIRIEFSIFDINEGVAEIEAPI